MSRCSTSPVPAIYVVAAWSIDSLRRSLRDLVIVHRRFAKNRDRLSANRSSVCDGMRFGSPDVLPARNRRSKVGRITGDTGKSAEDERVAAGSGVRTSRDAEGPKV